MNVTAIRKLLSRAQRLLPEPEREPLPAAVAAAALDAAGAVGSRTGSAELGERAALFVMAERLAEIDRGEVTPWIELDVFGEPSTDPAAIESLHRILDAIGFDATAPAERWYWNRHKGHYQRDVPRA